MLEETEMELPEEITDDLRKRLRRVAGQVQGVERMLDEGRECRDIVTQISAANRALEQVGFRLVSAGLSYCIANPEQAAADGYPIGEVEKMFMRLA
jgi:DNA-binding FrmR family transcriptional regulator